MADQEEDFSSLPLQDRFVHKNWKVRKEAYEAAAREFDAAQTEQDPLVRQFISDSSLWKGAVTDSNVAAHAEAINALCAFLQIGGPQASIRTRGSTLTALAEKGLISTKPATKQKALEAILLYIELDKPDPVIEELMPVLSHKLPKIIAATLSAFTAVFHNYGCKTVDPKAILKILPKVYGHADKNVRAEAQGLTVELYRWLREGMKPFFWNDLKPVQQTDLDAQFEKVKNEPPPKQERLLRSQQAKAAAAAEVAEQAASGGEGGDFEEAEGDFEPEMMAIDVSSKIPKDFGERIASTKWKDRKEALDDLQNVINVPAMEEGPFDEIMRALAKCILKDANIAVVTVAASCVEIFARGLKKKFAKYRSIVFGSIMERLKERKQSVTDALAGALDAICSATSLGDVLEETLEFQKHKNPLVKLEATRFLARALKLTRRAPEPPETKTIADSNIKLLSDSQETQRNAAADVLGALWKIMGDRIMNPHLDSLDDIRKAKVEESRDAAEVKTKYKPKAAAPPKAAPAAAPGKRPLAKKVGTPAAKKPAAAPRPAPVEEYEPAPSPLKAKPAARPVSSMPKPGVGRGLKPPSSLGAGPKKALQPPSASSGIASPRRAVHTPAEDTDEDLVPAPPKPALRGLAGRQLQKPGASAPPPAEQPIQTTTTMTNGLSSVERIELDELRSEVERLRTQNENYRADQLKLSSQINELQNQNAQLIEDHTRDVLSIKAKETQLVRARGDAETAEQAAQSMQREVERLKREITRISRSASERNGAMSPSAADIFPSSSDGAASGKPAVAGMTRPRSLMLSPTREGKENLGGGASAGNLSPFAKGRRLSPPAASLAPASSLGSPTASGAARPMTMFLPGGARSSSRDANLFHSNGPLSDSDARTSGSSTSSGMHGGGGFGGKNGDAGAGESGQESWRRAAEVTQNLKARIELMKARQQSLNR